jgi:hypothetical protein
MPEIMAAKIAKMSVSQSPEVFQPYLADAHERFPDVVELAFLLRGASGASRTSTSSCSPTRESSVSCSYSRSGRRGSCWRGAPRFTRPTPWAAGAGIALLCALLTLASEWASLGLVAGIPL